MQPRSILRHSPRTAKSRRDNPADRSVLVFASRYLPIPSTKSLVYKYTTSLWGLLHDASEAYLVDMPRPVKKCKELAKYVRAEDRLQKVICEKFSLDPIEPAEVLEADRRILATEARDLMSPLHPDWHWDFEPYKRVINPWSPKDAEASFLQRFRYLLCAIDLEHKMADRVTPVAGYGARYRVLPLKGPIPQATIENFWDDVDKVSAAPCWLWRGTINRTPGGNPRAMAFYLNQEQPAARLSWFINRGEIPPDAHVKHRRRCRLRGMCMNPEHLYLHTVGEAW